MARVPGLRAPFPRNDIKRITPFPCRPHRNCTHIRLRVTTLHTLRKRTCLARAIHFIIYMYISSCTRAPDRLIN